MKQKEKSILGNGVASELLSAFNKNHNCPFGEALVEALTLVKKGKPIQASTLLQQNDHFPLLSLKLCNWTNYFPEQLALSEKLEHVLQELPNSKVKSAKKTNKKIGIIGSGVCGLNCAKELALQGHHVNVYEALAESGGYLRYAVPDMVLPKDMLNHEIEKLEALGVEFHNTHVIGKVMTLDQLESQHHSLFLASGACHPRLINLKGQHLSNVYYANEYLYRINMMKAHLYPQFKTPVHSAKNTLVVGGGNMAVYCARLARSLGNNVTLIYRRSINEMTALPHEIKKSQDEGVSYVELTGPRQIKGDEKVEEVQLIQMMLEMEDERGRKNPIPIKDSEFNVEADQVILALGNVQNPTIFKDSKIRTGFGNKAIVNDQMQTSNEKIFAGGDIVRQSNNLSCAIRDGRNAATHIHNFLNGKR
tara:strand:+ start:2063 stop:3322 length:1260 start_codon:yes stop_codon:yes gene_type:complete